MAIKTKRKSSDSHAAPALLDTERRPILDSRQTGRYLGVTEDALRLWREKGGGPPFFKAGPRLIRYRRSDLDQWIAKRIEK
jgi:predicted DNA-binding transcriptional regulator AlpA